VWALLGWGYLLAFAALVLTFSIRAARLNQGEGQQLSLVVFLMIVISFIIVIQGFTYKDSVKMQFQFESAFLLLGIFTIYAGIIVSAILAYNQHLQESNDLYVSPSMLSTGGAKSKASGGKTTVFGGSGGDNKGEQANLEIIEPKDVVIKWGKGFFAQWVRAQFILVSRPLLMICLVNKNQQGQVLPQLWLTQMSTIQMVPDDEHNEVYHCISFMHLGKEWLIQFPTADDVCTFLFLYCNNLCTHNLRQ
jgi:hypothetical protein